MNPYVIETDDSIKSKLHKILYRASIGEIQSNIGERTRHSAESNVETLLDQLKGWRFNITASYTKARKLQEKIFSHPHTHRATYSSKTALVVVCRAQWERRRVNNGQRLCLRLLEHLQQRSRSPYGVRTMLDAVSSAPQTIIKLHTQDTLIEIIPVIEKSQRGAFAFLCRHSSEDCHEGCS